MFCWFCFVISSHSLYSTLINFPDNCNQYKIYLNQYQLLTSQCLSVGFQYVLMHRTLVVWSQHGTPSNLLANVGLCTKRVSSSFYKIALFNENNSKIIILKFPRNINNKSYTTITYNIFILVGLLYVLINIYLRCNYMSLT